MKIPTLKTERLILRPMALSDAPAIQHYFDDWEIIKYTFAPWPFPKDGAKQNLVEKTLPSVRQGKSISWAITLPDEKKYNGFIGRIDYRFNEDGIDRGFWLALPFQGQGLMTEAVMTTQDYMFFDHGIERFIVGNDVSNVGSRRVKEKTGAVLLRTEDNKPGSHVDGKLEIWEVTRENWAKIRGREI